MEQPRLEEALPIAATASEAPTMTALSTGPKALSSEFRDNISDRLSKLENLYFPRALLSSATTPAQRKNLLLDLLSRDVAVFLERYGSQLMLEELKGFDVLKDDYEINWHLSHIRSLINPTEDEIKSRSTKVKNRRRAYLDKLISYGDYFSEDAMREREPYLHHEYVGKFQDPTGRCMARPGERWSDTLIRQSEEAMLLQKIRGEQQRLGVAPSDWVGTESHQQEEEMMEEEEEEEEEEDEEEEDAEEEEEGGEEKEVTKTGMVSHMANGGVHNPEASSNGHNAENDNQSAMVKLEEGSLSAEELQDRMDQFTFIMHQKFLSGEDHEHLDYAKIDEDERLDDHWMKEANHDAEEKYFDDV